MIDNDFSVSRAQFISAVQSRDASTDIYVLPDSWNVWSLIDKGYARDLSAYPALRESVETMIPQLQQAVTRGDQIFALPSRSMPAPGPSARTCWRPRDTITSPKR